MAQRTELTQLNIRKFDAKLLARLKAKAALAGKTLGELVTELLRAGLAAK